MTSLPEQERQRLGEPTRVDISYKVLEGTPVKRIPFRAGVMANLSGHAKDLPALYEREFVTIDRGNFDKVLKQIAPKLELDVADTLAEDPDAKLRVELEFGSREDFEPMALVKRIPRLKALFEKREKLALAHRLGTDPRLDELLTLACALAAESHAPAAVQHVSERLEQVRAEALNALAAPQRKGFDDCWKIVIEEVRRGDLKLDRTAVTSLEARIAEIDWQMSEQLAAVLHHPEFQRLEGTWRGLWRFVHNTETKQGELEISVLDCSKNELAEDFRKAGKPHLSVLHRKTVSDVYQVYGGVPLGILVADYAWTGQPADIATLSELAEVAAASHTCVLTSPAPELFSYDSWQELDGKLPTHFADHFESADCIEWREFRNSEASRYVTMTLPRTLARLPYGRGKSKTLVPEFHFEELPLDERGENIEVPTESFCWSSSAYALAERITEAFFVWGWPTGLRGPENGGLVRDLPVYKYQSSLGDTRVMCPTEVQINFSQEYSLSSYGFCALQHRMETNAAAFGGVQTAHKPREMVERADHESEILSARLPYLLAVFRVSHYLRAIAHDMIGVFQERTDMQTWLNFWIRQYTDASDNPGDEIKRRFPFKKAEIEMYDRAAGPGFGRVKLSLSPWIIFGGFTADITIELEVETAFTPLQRH